MTETDDKLLKQFFGEQKQEIEDNGFSRRVMRNLPGRNHRLVQAWGAACAVVCVILFFTLGGLQATISTLREVFVSIFQLKWGWVLSIATGFSKFSQRRSFKRILRPDSQPDISNNRVTK